ncbi:MAG: hypothetical protein K2G47_11125 [Muribaculum sp.]|nr:hypothetical protein [Muribaculum sp.]
MFLRVEFALVKQRLAADERGGLSFGEADFEAELLHVHQLLEQRKPFLGFFYTAWTDTARLQEKCGNLPLVYPKSVEGSAIIRGTISLPGIKSANIFAAAMCYAAENLNLEIEKIEQTDYDNSSFSLLQRSTQGSNNTETTYTRKSLIECRDGSLSYTIYDIDARYREKGIVPRTLPFEKLNPATNTRHRELIEEFAAINAGYFGMMTDFIKENPGLKFDHPEAMSTGKPMPGMTELEIKVLLGMPQSQRHTGDRTRWIYSNDLIIIFTKGEVSKIID